MTVGIPVRNSFVVLLNDDNEEHVVKTDENGGFVASKKLHLLSAVWAQMQVWQEAHNRVSEALASAIDAILQRDGV